MSSLGQQATRTHIGHDALCLPEVMKFPNLDNDLGVDATQADCNISSLRTSAVKDKDRLIKLSVAR